MWKRTLVKSRIREGCLEEYKRLHDEIWPELMVEYKRLGIAKVSCFVDGLDLYVYSEIDGDFDHLRKPENMPFDVKFQKVLEPVKDHSIPRKPLTEVFHME